MRIYFDTEFTGLHKGTTLISIGMISEDERTFYAESTDYDRDQCDKWILDNVVSHLRFMKSEDGQKNYYIESRDKNNKVPNDLYKGYSVELQGNNVDIKEALTKWLSQFESIEFISDVCHYDMVLLIDIFGGAFDLPKNICPACYDINQDIALKFNIPLSEAFARSREDILLQAHEEVKGDKHNALYDAKVIKEIYHILKCYRYRWLQPVFE